MSNRSHSSADSNLSDNDPTFDPNLLFADNQLPIPVQSTSIASGHLSDSDDEPHASPSLLVEKEFVQQTSGHSRMPTQHVINIQPANLNPLHHIRPINSWKRPYMPHQQHHVSSLMTNRPIQGSPNQPFTPAHHNIYPPSNMHTPSVPLQNKSIRSSPLPHDSLIADPEIVKAEWKREAIEYFIYTADLNQFLIGLYDYYVGKGFACLSVTRFTHLLTIAFLVSFSTFLVGCVDYQLLRTRKHLFEIVTPHCHSTWSWPVLFVWWSFWIWWSVQLFKSFVDMHSLQAMKQFVNHGLDISENELQTISWREVVNRLLAIRDQARDMHSGRLLPRSLLKLDAHQIASRIMRQDNYMIAIINKDLLNLKIPWIGTRHLLTKQMEWTIQFSIFSLLFDSKGNLKRSELNNRETMIVQLKRRIFLMGLLNLLLAPFLAVFTVLYFFFRYAEEFHKDPGRIGSRKYSRFAYWKFREFNEFGHVFMERLNRSYRRANFYLEQFPNHAFIVVVRFLAFVAGSFAAVLTVIALMDQDILMNFEITPGVTALFYIGVFSGLFAAFKSMVPEEHQVYDPETILRKVIEDVHYFPDQWRNQLHTESVKKQFSALFEYNIVLLAHEILSVVFAPWICWFSLIDCSDSIVDFFKEFSIHVDEIGYVCSFSVFDFKRHGNMEYGAPTGPANHNLTSNQGKMEKSFVNFKYHHPEWEPDCMEGSQYLSFLLSKMPSSQSQLYVQGAPLHNQHRTPPIQLNPQPGYLYPTQNNNQMSMMDHPTQQSMADRNEMVNSEIFGVLDDVYVQNHFQQHGMP